MTDESSYDDADYIAARVRTPVVFSRYCSERLELRHSGKSARDIDVMGADASYFAIKNYEVPQGRPFSPQEVRAGAAIVVLGDLVAEKLFERADPVGKEVMVGGLPHRVIGVVAKQGTLFGISMDKFAIVPFESPATFGLWQKDGRNECLCQCPCGSQFRGNSLTFCFWLRILCRAFGKGSSIEQLCLLPCCKIGHFCK